MRFFIHKCLQNLMDIAFKNFYLVAYECLASSTGSLVQPCNSFTFGAQFFTWSLLCSNTKGIKFIWGCLIALEPRPEPKGALPVSYPGYPARSFGLPGLSR
jgi:hypothetical protein